MIVLETIKFCQNWSHIRHLAPLVLESVGNNEKEERTQVASIANLAGCQQAFLASATKWSESIGKHCQRQKKQDNEYCNLVLGFNSIKLPTEGWGWVRDSCATPFLTNACNNFDKYMPHTTWFGKSLSGKATLGLDLGLITLTKWLIWLKSIFRAAKTRPRQSGWSDLNQSFERPRRASLASTVFVHTRVLLS